MTFDSVETPGPNLEPPKFAIRPTTKHDTTRNIVARIKESLIVADSPELTST